MTTAIMTAEKDEAATSDQTAATAPRAENRQPHPGRADGGRQGKGQQQRRRQNEGRSRKLDINGWLILDKPIGMTSTHAVAVVKRIFNARKAGHAGTLDPLASGILPIALGEGTKTVPYVMDGRKAYAFTVSWGAETNTDDTEGEVTARSDRRPTREEVEALLPRFTGELMQVPPRFSAIKIDGERAYDLARDGEEVELAARPVLIHRLTLVEHTGDTSTLEAECGKGTYVRAIARDLGRAIGCLGHVATLRRTRVGPFRLDRTISLAALQELSHKPPVDNEPGETVDDRTIAPALLSQVLLPVETALDDIPALAVNRADAVRLARGQTVLLRGRDAPIIEGPLAVTCQGRLVAVADLEAGEIVARRVFNLSGAH
ncbi:tRNA pseudouridine(55) synthase TruB [Pseudochelatococcus contaminans]|uniref:tRNA pseudouridine synthase B n=1 Tax=Pseudochelatococcus contaminans TaxID=1538103 RepID=A0A7W6EGL9_9HYPH|nr:tRNA pseudouridine(55) synthase TruB [Pseudochelatococcus contaminans]MBB3809107.1 tRNA pseudouridine55 synthase [Pseudochelatococcus contaminans]